MTRIASAGNALTTIAATLLAAVLVAPAAHAAAPATLMPEFAFSGAPDSPAAAAASSDAGRSTDAGDVTVAE